MNEKAPEYIVPDELAGNEVAMKTYEDAMNTVWAAYKKLQELGYKNEIARYVLPNACQTKICMTMNFRALRNFLKLRCSKRAQPEIRKLAYIILDKVCEIAPSCFADLKDEANLQNT